MNNLAELIEVCQWMNEKNFSPATSGNYSLRIDEMNLYVSASGVDKGKIKTTDFIPMDLTGKYQHETLKPSDEAMIHATIMRMVQKQIAFFMPIVLLELPLVYIRKKTFSSLAVLNYKKLLIKSNLTKTLSVFILLRILKI